MNKSLLLFAVFATISSGSVLASPNICTNCPVLNKVKDITNYAPGTYYADSQAAYGGDLATFRKAIISDISKGQKQLSYGEVWTALTHTDEDPQNSDNVILLYKGNSIPKNHNGSGAASANQDYWNREHTWPKSHGFPKKSQQGYTDIHHLRPADISMNSARGNKDFHNGGTPVPEDNRNLSTKYTWEPRDEVKGDIARMMFYMDVRYDENTGINMPNLVLVDAINTNPTSGKNLPKLGKLCTLIEWHFQDPVNDFERARNNTIYEYQGNRNPFIDNPEWVDTIYKGRCNESKVPDQT
ncbi:endonuclease [Moritella sp. 5]|uniref:endonuclease I family protein n=1 Tax=Moritella sp. 5 TaxID=2746231 RepID=UPI001BACBDEE|nr:endonuclease [Moritella sp. 5]QUM79439.1 endonuclease [Moritella sp. 5]